MSWTVGDIENQVLQLSGYRNISDKLLAWTNRTVAQIGQKAFWTKQVQSASIGGASQTNTISDQWFSATGLALSNFIAMRRIDYGTHAMMVRQAVEDLYKNFHGLVASYSVGSFEKYAIAKYGTCTSGNDQFMAPYIAVYPIYATNTSDFTAHFLAAPAKFTTTTDTHWILDKYPSVIIAGVMRYVELYVGNLQGYLSWKKIYLMGISNMMKTEESSVASTPNMRGVLPELVMRGVR